MGKRTRRQKRAASLSPLELMLENMQHFHQLALEYERRLEAINRGNPAKTTKSKLSTADKAHVDLLHGKALEFRKLAQACANGAAPYRHGRLKPKEERPEGFIPLHVRIRVLDDAQKKEAAEPRPATSPQHHEPCGIANSPTHDC